MTLHPTLGWPWTENNEAIFYDLSAFLSIIITPDIWGHELDWYVCLMSSWYFFSICEWTSLINLINSFSSCFWKFTRLKEPHNVGISALGLTITLDCFFLSSHAACVRCRHSVSVGNDVTGGGRKGWSCPKNTLRKCACKYCNASSI